MKPILEIHSISKKFSINHEQQPYLSLRDSISGMFKNKTSKEDFWALKDVSFNVMPGDTVGIIGKNGAGKSTLLKILSKITPPTSGKIVSRGRIASLLEVGTGFHPELSGRENIFMNGSILGMRKAEILKNFDEIVDFAGVEKFIDTPLKHYSSGMQLRLAFAVAAFLENEILIIDEVLAVGDAEFQKKCMGKMEDVSKSGRTILFVSHNVGAVQQLCKKGVVLDKGTTKGVNEIADTLLLYLKGNHAEITESLINKKRRGIGEIKFEQIVVHSPFGGKLIRAGKKLSFDLHYISDKMEKDDYFEFVIGIWNSMGMPMFMVTNTYIGQTIRLHEKSGVVTFEIEKLPLNKGRYSVNLLLKKNGIDMDFIENAYEFEVDNGNYFNGSSFYPEWYSGFYCEFKIKY